MIDALVPAGGRARPEHGYAPPTAPIQEVSQTLQAALGDPEVAELVRAGRPHPGGELRRLRSRTTWLPPWPPRLPAAEPKASRRRRRAQTRPRRPGSAGRDTAEDPAAEAAEPQTGCRPRPQRPRRPPRRPRRRPSGHRARRRTGRRVESLRSELREAEDQPNASARDEARSARKHSTELRRRPRPRRPPAASRCSPIRSADQPAASDPMTRRIRHATDCRGASSCSRA